MYCESIVLIKDYINNVFQIRREKKPPKKRRKQCDKNVYCFLKPKNKQREFIKDMNITVSYFKKIKIKKQNSFELK